MEEGSVGRGDGGVPGLVIEDSIPLLSTNVSPTATAPDTQSGSRSLGQPYSPLAILIKKILRPLPSSVASFSTNGKPPTTIEYKTTPKAHASVFLPSYFFPMINSGAAYASEPHRVERRGEVGEMKRERPKSVSLMKGVGRERRTVDGSQVGKGRYVKRMSGQRKAKIETKIRWRATMGESLKTK